MSYEEERIAKLTFDNSDFEKKVKGTIKALDKLDSALQLDTNSDKTLEKLARGCDELEDSLTGVEESVVAVKNQFSALQAIGFTVFAELTKASINFGKKIYNNTLGQILSGGATRSKNIEQAKFQLEGLEVAWSDISEVINYGVKDTAYGLDAAAKVASQLVASQVPLVNEVGEQVDNMWVALRGISGVAAMTNRSYEEVGHIFTTVAGQGRLMAMQLNQLSGYGLNAAATLADYLETTEANVRDMVSKGQISFDQFARAMDDAFGEHAKDANKTLDGALSNVKASLSRIGAEFITPWNEFKRVFFNDIIPIFNFVKDTLGDFVGDFKMLLNMSSKWLHNLLTNENFMKAIALAVYNVYTWVRTLMFALFDMGYAMPKVESLGDGMLDFLSNFQLYGERAMTVIGIIKDILSIFDVIFAVIRNVAKIIEPIFSRIISIFANLFGLTGKISGNIFSLSRVLIPLIDKLGDFISSGLENTLQKIDKFLPALVNGFKLLFKIVQLVAGGLLTIFTSIGKTLKSLVNDPINTLKTGLITIGTLIVWLVLSADKALSYLADRAMGMFAAIASAVSSFNPISLIAGAVGGGNSSESIVESNNKIIESTNEVIDTMNSASESESKYEEETGKHAAAMSRYSDTISRQADSMEESGKKYNGVVKGISKDIDDASKSMSDSSDNFGKSITLFNEQVTSKLSSGANELSNSIGHIVDDVGETASNRITNTSHIISDVANESMEESTSTVLSTIGSVLGGFGNKALGIINAAFDFLVAGINTLSDHIKSPWKILTDIMLVGALGMTISVIKVFSTIAGALAIIPEIFASLTAMSVGFAADRLTTMLEVLGKTLLAFAGLLAVIAIISRLVDPSDFERVMDAVKELGDLVITASKMYIIVAALNGIFGTVNVILQKVLKVTAFSWANTLKAIASVILASILALYAVYEAIQLINTIPTNEFVKGLVRISFILGIFLVYMVIIDKTMNNMSVVNRSITNISKGINSENTFSSSIGGVIALLLSTIPLIFALTKAINTLGTMDPAILRQGGIALAGLLLALAGFISITAFSLVGFTDVSTTNKLEKEITVWTSKKSDTLGKLATFIKSFALAALGLTAAIWLLGKMDPNTLKQGGFTLLAILGGLSAFAAVIGIISTIQGKLVVNDSHSFGESINSLANFINSFSISIMSIVAAIAILSLIPVEDIKTGIDTITQILGTLAVISVVLTLVGAVSNAISGKTDKQGSLKGVSDTLTGMAAMLLACSVSLAIIAAIPENTLEQATETIKVLLEKLTIIFAVLGAFAASGASKAEAASLWPVVGIMAGIVGSILAITLLMYTIDTVQPENILYTFGIVLGLFGGLAVAFVAFSFIVKNLSTGAEKASEALTTVDKQAKQTYKDTIAAGLKILLISAGISLIVLALKEVILSMDSIEWDAGTISSSIAVVVTAMLSLFLMSKLMDNMAKSLKPKDILASAALLGSISIVFISIAGAFKILDTLDFGHPVAMILSLMLSLGAIAGLIAVISYFNKTPLNTGSILATLGGCTAIILSLALLLKVIDSMSLDLGTTLGALGIMSIVLGSIIGVILLVTFAEPVALAAQAALIAISTFIAALASLFLSIGAMSALISAAVLGFEIAFERFVDTLMKFPEMDWGGILKSAMNLPLFFSYLYLGLSQMFSVIPSLLAVAIALPSLAFSLTAFANIPTDMITTAGENISAFLVAIGEAMNEVDAGLLLKNSLALGVFAFAMLGTSVILLAVGVAAGLGLAALMGGLYALREVYNLFDEIDMGVLNAKAGGMLAFALLLLVPGLLMLEEGVLIGLGLAALMGGLFALREIYTLWGEIDMGVLNAKAGGLLAFALLLIIPGVLMFEEGVLIGLGLAALMGGLFALRAIYNLWDEIDMGVLNGKAAGLLAFAIILGITNVALAGASLSFILASGLLIAGSTIFSAASTFLLQGLENVADGVNIACAAIINAVDTAMYAANGLASVADTFEGIGENVVDGFVEGLDEEQETAVESMLDFVSAITAIPIKEWDIHSPSEFFRSIGMYTIAGFCEGIEDSFDSGMTAIGDFVAGINDSFENGLSLGDIISNAIQDALGVLGTDGDSLISSFGTLGKLEGQAQGTAYGNTYRRIMAAAYADELHDLLEMQTSLEDTITALQSKGMSASEEMETLQSVKEQISAIMAKQAKAETFQMPELPSGGGSSAEVPELSGELSSGALSAAGGAGTSKMSGVDPNMVASNVGSTITTNNTYNFTQNNYSPEPIDRTELYTQTNNQLNTWYSWLRDN